MKKIIALILTLLVFAAGMTAMYFSYDFKYLDSTYRWKAFYALPDNTVDVLGLGTSHTYESINTAVLWDKYGVTAFDLCGTAQPMTNTYWFFKEALKTQSPKVALLDLYSMCLNDEFPDEGNGIKNTYGMRMSRNKLDAINATFESPRQYYYSLLQYHSRYGDLTAEDFFPYLGNERMYKDYKGFYCHFETKDLSGYGDLSDCTGFEPLSEKNKQALLDIIVLAKQNNVNLVLLGLPFGATSFNEEIYNTCGLIARANGVPFYDFLSDYYGETGIDYISDFADRQHLNDQGSEKMTDWIYDNILIGYDLPSHSGESGYETWDRDAEVWERQQKNQKLASCDEISSYAGMLSVDSDYTVLVTSNGIGGVNVENALNEGLFDCLDALGIGDERRIYGDGGWISRGGEVEYQSSMRDAGMVKTYELSRLHDAALARVAAGGDKDAEIFRNTVLIDGEDVTGGRMHTLYITVYDSVTDEVIDTVYFDYRQLTFGHVETAEE